jgi:hypothetical protein
MCESVEVTSNAHSTLPIFPPSTNSYTTNTNTEMNHEEFSVTPTNENNNIEVIEEDDSTDQEQAREDA